MIPAYAKAFFSQPPAVFGLRLRPFSIGHSYLLEAIENPVAMGEPYAPQDAAVFAKVCSMSWADALAFLNDWETKGKEMRRMGKACARADMHAECAKIDDYLREAMDCIPPRWDKDGAKTECKIPIQLAFFHILKGGQAITPQVEAAIWDMPFGRAAVYAAAAGWAKGDDSLMTREEVRKVELLNAGRAA